MSQNKVDLIIVPATERRLSKETQGLGVYVKFPTT